MSVLSRCSVVSAPAACLRAPGGRGWRGFDGAGRSRRRYCTVGHRTAATDTHRATHPTRSEATSAQSCTDGGHSARLTRDAAAAAAAAAQTAAPTATMRATTDLRLPRGREADAAAGP